MKINPLPDGHPETNHPGCLSAYAEINAAIVANAPKTGKGDEFELWKELSRKHSEGLWQNIWANIPRIRSWRAELGACERASEAGEKSSDDIPAKVVLLKNQVSEWMTYTKALMALDRRMKDLLRKYDRAPPRAGRITRLYWFNKANPTARPAIFTRISPPLSREEREMLAEEDRRGDAPVDPNDHS